MDSELKMKAIAQAVLEYAKSTPDKIAVYFENDEYSYAQLASMSKKVALWIKSIGINEGSRIIVEASHTTVILHIHSHTNTHYWQGCICSNGERFS